MRRMTAEDSTRNVDQEAAVCPFFFKFIQGSQAGYIEWVIGKAITGAGCCLENTTLPCVYLQRSSFLGVFLALHKQLLKPKLIR